MAASGTQRPKQTAGHAPPGTSNGQRRPAPAEPVAREERLRPPGSDWLYLKLYGPREDEDELLAGPVWHYPRDRWTSPRDAYAEDNEPLREAITAELTRIMADAYGTSLI